MLEVQARDYGSPLLSTSVLVNIVIEDANDNPPLFPEGNYTVFVQEDKPYGHILLTFSVIGACIIALRQRPRSPTPEQLLIEEVLRDPHAAEHGLPPSPLQPWERPPDWWKQNQP